MALIAKTNNKNTDGGRYTIDENVLVEALKHKLEDPAETSVRPRQDKEDNAKVDGHEEDPAGERDETAGSIESQGDLGDHGVHDLLTWELVTALAELAQSETYNLEILNGETNVLNLILKILERRQNDNPTSAEIIKLEHYACALYLMNVSAHEAGPRLIKQTENLVPLLKKLSKDEDEDTFTLNNIESVISRVESIDKEQAVSEISESGNRETETTDKQACGRDIFISYCSKHKQVVNGIATDLKKHYNVWIDTDDMKGPTIKCMAQGIEGAAVFLLCYSEEYESSRNCHDEAVHAREMMKKIIPIKVTKFHPKDGWLRFILGDLFYHDFSKGEPFYNESMKGLLKELKGLIRDIPEAQSTSTSSQERAPMT